MNERERFLNTMRFKPADRAPFWYPWVWGETLARWRNEGLPRHFNMSAHFGCDTIDEYLVSYNVLMGFAPPFTEVEVSEDETTRTYIDTRGITLREMKQNRETSMPQFLDFPVKTRDDYHKLKSRLQFSPELRFPAAWGNWCELWKTRKRPLRFWGDNEFGFFGPFRHLMGVENLAMAFYDEPALLEEMMDDRVELMLKIIGKVLDDTDIDFFMFWEDMAYKNGPLISPELFKKFMSPRYKIITDYLRSRGVDLIFVDSDGDVTKLIPLWLEAGVNGMFPMEVQSGMDVVAVRQKYGKDILMIGGINKYVLSLGKSEIDDELRRIRPVISKGGYIPWPDHSIPPNVPLENMMYFMSQLEKTLSAEPVCP